MLYLYQHETKRKVVADRPPANAIHYSSKSTPNISGQIPRNRGLLTGGESVTIGCLYGASLNVIKRHGVLL